MSRIAFLTANEGIESIELTDPWDSLEQAGHDLQLLAPQAGKVQLFDHLDKAETREAGSSVSEASAASYDALVLPGGVANPDALRMDEDAVSFVREFVESGKPVAAICHAPWMLVEADVVRGRRVASWPSLQTDLRNAGAEWADETVVVDGNLITSRKPDDLPAFTEALLTALDSS
jgi:protease I